MMPATTPRRDRTTGLVLHKRRLGAVDEDGLDALLDTLLTECFTGAFIHKRCAPSGSCVCLPVFVFAPPTLPLFVVFPFCVTARSILVAHCFTYVYVVMCNPLSCASCSSFVQPAVRGQSDKGRGQLRLTVSVSGIKQQVASNGCR